MPSAKIERDSKTTALSTMPPGVLIVLYAVTIAPLRAVFFLDERPEENGWQVEEGVELDLPFNYDSWPEGEERPEQILCTSIAEPKHYKMFKYRRDIDTSEFRPTQKHFGGIYSRSTWSRFVKSLPTGLVDRNVPDREPLGATDEAVNAIKRRA
jgi:hypothetical protein